MPPENSGYMYAAYVAAGVIYAGYTLSIWWRARVLMRRSRTELGARDARVES